MYVVAGRDSPLPWSASTRWLLPTAQRGRHCLQQLRFSESAMVRLQLNFCQFSFLHPVRAPAVVRIDPLHFLAGCRKRRLNQALSVLYNQRFINCFLLFIRATFCISLVCVWMCSVCWLFRLSCQYLPSDWLERLLWWHLFVARWSSPQSPGRRTFMTDLV